MAKAKGNTRISPGAAGEGFWDRPSLMNLASDLLLLAAGVLLAWAGATALQRLPVAPLKQLVVVTPLDRVARAQVEHAARTAIAGNFFTVDLATAQAAFERLPWVRRADLRRRWPDRLELSIEEHRPVARWPALEGESRLVNSHGEVFLATSTDPLPVFVGPEGAAARVLDRYQTFAAGLAVIGRRPVALHLSRREAWSLKLDDGVVLELGRDQPKAPVAERLARFTDHYASARERLPAVSVVDMRYPNGFALRANNS